MNRTLSPGDPLHTTLVERILEEAQQGFFNTSERIRLIVGSLNLDGWETAVSDLSEEAGVITGEGGTGVVTEIVSLLLVRPDLVAKIARKHFGHLDLNNWDDLLGGQIDLVDEFDRRAVAQAHAQIAREEALSLAT